MVWALELKEWKDLIFILYEHDEGTFLRNELNTKF